MDLSLSKLNRFMSYIEEHIKVPVKYLKITLVVMRKYDLFMISRMYYMYQCADRSELMFPIPCMHY